MDIHVRPSTGRSNAATYLVAEQVLRELGRPTLLELLDLTALIAQKDAARHSRVAARWLFKYLEANGEATIYDAALVDMRA